MRISRWMLAISFMLSAPFAGNSLAANKPNIVVIITDDQGYADISFNPHHPPEVSTPHMDALAREGVFFTQAYTSGSVCSPTRTGLMLGRYQQKLGVYTGGDGGRGIDPTIPIFPAMLPEDYVSMAVGKWHLGLDEDYPDLKWHPVNRGFDESFNFMGRGGHDYFSSGGVKSEEESPFYRGKERVSGSGYLTNRLTDEAVGFIERHSEQPFFLYLAYNAVHAPAQAPEQTIAKYRERFPELSPQRQILMAMLEHLDLGVGRVVDKLKERNVFDNTLLFFLTDNGGAKGMEANNSPLRGFKHSVDEGGIRTPFIVSWPDRFQGGRKINTPVISLDILPTALEAAGHAPPQAGEFDGKSLLPLLGGNSTPHHDALLWSEGSETDWAIRKGDWKLKRQAGDLILIDLADDPAEKSNVVDRHPDIVRQLVELHEAWMHTLAPSISGATDVPDPAVPLTEREMKRLERRKQRLLDKDAPNKSADSCS